MSAPIYLDYAATTPVAPEVARAMSAVLGEEADFGNPSAVTHLFGRRAQARIEAARAQVAALIHASPEDVVFTSGATESNNLALLGIARASVGKTRHIVTSKIEHKAVLDPCRQLEREGFAVTYVAPDSSGRVQPDSVRAALRPDTVLVSVMHANNEIGVIQDIEAIGALCRERGIAFHVDAAQSVGKLPVDVSALPVDLLSFTAHKIYGPKGVGALYVHPRVRARLKPVMYGGGQERGLRPGTLPTHQIVGFGAACELAAKLLATEPARLARLRDRLWQGLSRLESVHLNGEAAPRLPGILNVSFEGVEGESLVTALDSLAVTTGSACSSASGDPSYVLRALGRSTQLAQSSLRFSLGRATTEADIDAAIDAVRRQVIRLRAVSPASPVELGGGGEAPRVSADVPGAGVDVPPAASADVPPANVAVSRASVDVPRASADVPRVSADVPGAGVDVPPAASADVPPANVAVSRGSVAVSRASVDVPRASVDVPRASADVPRASADVPRASVGVPRVSADAPRVSADVSRATVDVSRANADISRASVGVPRVSADLSRASVDVPRVSAGDAVQAADFSEDSGIGFEGSAGTALSPSARRYFASLPGAGAMAPGPGVFQGTAGGPEHEAWVRIHLRVERRAEAGVEGDVVKAALFQAWGCPHTLAVTAWLTGQLPGRSMTDLVPGTPSAWLEALDVPVEKLGRLLVVEDALRAAFQEWEKAP